MTLTTKKTTVSHMLVAGGLTIVLMALMMAYFQVTPFGTKNLLVGDMSAQYLQFLTYFRHSVLSGHFATYSFNFGVGENLFPVVAYYLISPFNLLVLLGNVSQIPTTITLILILKLACVSMAMVWFLEHHFSQTSWLTIGIGLAFALSGFVAADYVNIMWLDGLIYLPLIAYGIDRLRAGHSGVPLYVWLTLSILSNYYIGYMTGIFTLIYFMYVMMVDTVPPTVGQTPRIITHWVLVEGASVLTSGIVLVPTLMGMLQTAKVTTSSSEFALKPMYGLEIFSQMGIGGAGYANRLVHAPTIFSTIVVAVLALSYFLNTRIEKRRRTGALVVLAVLLMSMFIQPINTAWHMFHQPAGSPFRYAFLVSFVAIMIAYEAWLAHPERLSWLRKAIIPVLLGGSLIVGYGYTRLMKTHAVTTILHHYYGVQPASLRLLVVNLIVVLVASALVLIRLQRRQLVSAGLIGLMAAEVGLNFRSALAAAPLASQTGYEKDYQAESKLLQPYTQNADSQLSRVNFDGKSLQRTFKSISYSGYNDSLLYNFNGIKQYDSTLDELTRETLRGMGIYTKNARRVSNQGVTSISDLLLGVKATVNAQTGGTVNPNYVGSAFPVTSRFTNTVFSQFSIYHNLESLLQAMKPSTGRYLTPVTHVSHQQLATSGNTQLHRYQITVTPKVSGPVYLEAADASSVESTITVNGKLIPETPAVNHAFLVKLGTFKKGERITVHITAGSSKIYKKAYMMSLNLKRYHQLIAKYRQIGVTPSIKRNRVSATLTRSSANQKWGYFAIPYNTGWQASVNGKPVQIKRVVDHLMAVPLSANTNHVVLTYHVPGLPSGTALSVAGVFIFGLVTVLRRRRKNDTEQLDD